MRHDEARDDGGNRLDRRQLLGHGLRGAALLGVGNVLVACGGDGATGTGPASKISPGPPTGGTPQRGGTLIIGLASAGASETIDPRKAINNPDFARCHNLYDPLFHQVPGGVKPALATSAEPNADATAWTITLRDGVTWHDGKPFTADDVVYTIRTWGSKDSNYYGAATTLIDLKAVRKVDELTVHVPLLMPFAAFPAFTSWVTGLIVQDGTTDFTKPVGTGPFKFKSFTPGSDSVFTANPDYWRGRPYVDALRVNSSFQGDAERVNAVLSGQVHIAPGVPPSLARANEGSGRMVLGNAPGPGMNPLVMRVNVAPFDDARVVQAFKLAVDREAVVQNAYNGYATTGNDCPGATLEYWADGLEPTYDPEKAKSLLKAAGREGLSLPLYTTPAAPGIDETATVISAHLKAAGVDVPVKRLPLATYFTSASPAYGTDKRQLSMSQWGIIQPSLGAFYQSTLTSGGQYDETGWQKRAGENSLILAAMAETDPDKAREKWRAAQEQQVKEGGYLVPANINYVDGYAPNVRGVVTNEAGVNANFTYYKGWLTT